VFCTPERLTQAGFVELLKTVHVALVAVDEAHCISQWGHDFRPAYLEMAGAIEALGRPPVLALTATATEEVIEDIGRQLNRARMHVVNTGVYRPNLRYGVVQVTNPDQKLQEALRLVRETPGTGIVYAATVKAAEELHVLLEAAGESVTLYHGKLASSERKANQDLFMQGAARDGRDQRLRHGHRQAGHALRDPPADPGQPGGLLPGIGPRRPRRQGCRLHPAVPAGRQARAAVLPGEALSDGRRNPRRLRGRARTGRTGRCDAARVEDVAGELAGAHLKVCLKLLKDARLLRQNRKLVYLATASEPKDTLFDGDGRGLPPEAGARQGSAGADGVVCGQRFLPLEAAARLLRRRGRRLREVLPLR
jgi:ATP-dependent DNA helicase RecQ